MFVSTSTAGKNPDVWSETSSGFMLTNAEEVSVYPTCCSGGWTLFWQVLKCSLLVHLTASAVFLTAQRRGPTLLQAINISCWKVRNMEVLIRDQTRDYFQDELMNCSAELNLCQLEGRKCNLMGVTCCSDAVLTAALGSWKVTGVFLMIAV